MKNFKKLIATATTMAMVTVMAVMQLRAVSR